MTVTLKQLTFHNINEVQVMSISEGRSYGRRFQLTTSDKELKLKELFCKAQKLTRKASSLKELASVKGFIDKLITVEKAAICEYEERDCVYKFRSWFHRLLGGAFWGSHLERLESLDKKVNKKNVQALGELKDKILDKIPFFNQFLSQELDVVIDGQTYAIIWNSPLLQIGEFTISISQDSPLDLPEALIPIFSKILNILENKEKVHQVISNFDTLDEVDKREIYQEANQTHNFNLVEHLNNLGMKPEIPNFSGPAIITNFMDIATKHATILEFLKNLRKTNKFLTQKEFNSKYSTMKWFSKKNDLSRILGADYLKQKIQEENLMHLRVPLKIAVVEKTTSLTIRGQNVEGLYEIRSDQIKIYAESIESVKRKISRTEIDEFIHIIEIANFTDLNVNNIVVAADGIYFIDTEFKSFSGEILWMNLHRFSGLISEEDSSYFHDKINEKIAEPKKVREIIGYDALCELKEGFDNGTLPEKYITQGKEAETKIQKLEYVGMEEFGDWIPNVFPFDLDDLL